MHIIWILFLLPMLLWSTAPLEKVSLQLKWKYQFQFAGFIMAKEKGFYRDVGLDVELKEINNSINVINDLKSGATDFAISDSSLILEYMKGQPILALLAIFQESPFVLMGIKSDSVKKIADLRGKKIALNDNINNIDMKAMLHINHIEHQHILPVYNIDNMIEKHIDFISGYLSNEPFIAKERGLELTIFNPSDYGFKSYGDILFTLKAMRKEHPELVDKMYRASKKGWEYAFKHIDESVDMIYKNYNTLKKSKNALYYEAKELKKLSGLPNNFGDIKESKIRSSSQIFAFMFKDKFPSHNFKDFIYHPKSIKATIPLTKAENKYLQDKEELTLCIKEDTYPFIMYKDKQATGVSVDFLKIISEKINTDINFIKIHSDIKKFDTIELEKCDIISIVITTTSNHPSSIISSKPYIYDDIVIATHNKTPYISNLSSLNEKVGIPSYSLKLIEYVKTQYPNINLVYQNKLDLEEIIDEKLYGIIYPSLTLTNKIATNYFNDLKIMTKLSKNKLGFGFGIAQADTLLLSILNKSLDSISQEEKDNITNRWRSVKVEKHIDMELIYNISILLGFILIIITFIIWLLRKTNKKLNKILNGTIEAIAIFKEGKLTYANKQLLNLYGYESLSEIKGKIPLDFIVPQYREIVKKNFKKRTVEYETIMIRKDGTTFSSIVKGNNIGKNKRMASVIDISLLKNTQKSLEDLNKSLESRVKKEISKSQQYQAQMFHQSRLAQMGEMISMIAHQWRQPLNNLSLLTQTIAFKYERGKLNDALIKEFNTNTREQIFQMSKTIDDFRNFFKPNNHKDIFNIDNIIYHSLKMVNPIFEQHSIKVDYNHKKEVNIFGFDNELGQVLINIFNNAKDALMENRVKDKVLKITVEEKHHLVTIKIQDNAGGIPQEHIKKIFDPYFSTKSEKNGTGLGLYMSKMIIEDHMDGELNVINDTQGAVFEIKLHKGLESMSKEDIDNITDLNFDSDQGNTL